MSIQSEITRITNKRDLSFIAVESKGVTVPTGATIDDLPGLIELIVQSGGVSGSGGPVYQDPSGYVYLSSQYGAAIGVIDTLDSGGGIIRTINGIDLSNDTVSSSVLMSGYVAHDSQGNSIVGTLVIPTYEIWTGGSYGS